MALLKSKFNDKGLKYKKHETKAQIRPVTPTKKENRVMQNFLVTKMTQSSLQKVTSARQITTSPSKTKIKLPKMLSASRNSRMDMDFNTIKPKINTNLASPCKSPARPAKKLSIDFSE